MKNIFTPWCFFLILLTSCERQKSGYVIEKWHEPARTCTQVIPISTGKTLIMAPYTVHDGEDWCIRVASLSSKGDTITRMYYITAEAYDTLVIGKFVCVDGARSEDTNNEKIRQ